MTTEDIITKQFKERPLDYADPKEIDAGMRQGLAEAYAKDGFRRYLENAINHLKENAATKSSNWEEVLVRRGGIMFLKQLLDVSHVCYSEYLKINKITQQNAQKREKQENSQ